MASPQLRILVPLEDPSTEAILVDLAAALANPPWGEIHLTHVITPSSERVENVDLVLSQRAEDAMERGVGALVHIEYGESVTEEIRRAIERWSCNMMLMGWKADVESTAILAAANRALTKDVDVDTLIFKERNFAPAKRILVPTGGGPHSLLGIQIAYDLAQTWGAELEILRIARDARCDPHDPLLRRYCSQLTQDTHLQLELLGIDVPLTIIPSAEVVPTIVEQAKGHDLVVIGASNDWRQEEHLGGSIPDKIANQVPCSALMVRSAVANDMHLSRIFWEQMIRLEMHPKDKWDAIAQMVEILIEEEQFPSTERDMVLAAAINREKQGSTALGHNTAIPHAPIPDLPGIIGCLGICPQGIDFESKNGEKVQFIFLLLTPQQNYRSYIPILAQIATVVRNEDTRQALLASQTPSEVTAQLKKQEPI
ncbi:MAG: PTS sugar transporter subunit IIA [Candidatus Latescibacterota bacterium]|jgi:mannitol/fructose-specific phosphotransferase system IIA component (Ntr-type)/nucleotide-binding universal stress UspA family protein